MKRRFISFLLVAVLLAALCAAAEAEATEYGTMMVDHCESWVSLRDRPSTSGARLAKVPLYAIVTDAMRHPSWGDFVYCEYNGQYGYILSQYLVPWADPEPEDGYILDRTLEGYHITAQRDISGEIEVLTIACEDAAGSPLWTYETTTSYMTELTLTEAFIGGAAQDPMVMAFNAEKGLVALDPVSGAVRWQLTDVDLGASISWATDGDGTTYIGGYYGPDPVAIDVNGHVLWKADSQGCYWLYSMAIEGNRLSCLYDVMNGDHDTPGSVTYDLSSGSIVNKEYN